MSFNISTIKNPYISLKADQALNFDLGGIEDISLQLNTKAPHELEITINPNLGKLYYDFLENPNIGIRIDQDDGLSLGFIKKPQDSKRETTAFSKSKINFISTVALLKNTRAYPRQIPIGFIFKGFIKSYFQSINNQINIDYISPDRYEEVYVMAGDCYDLLEDGVDRLGNLSWRDMGIVNNQISLEIGDARSRKTDPKLLAINPVEGDLDPNLILIKDLQIFESGEVLTHLRPMGDTGSGGDLSTTLFITDENFNKIKTDENYPLVESKETLATGQKIYEIQNNLANSDIEKGEVYVVNLASDFQEGNKASTFSQIQDLYNRSVNFLKGKNRNLRYDLDLELRKIVLPGTKFKVLFAQKQSDGSVLQFNSDYSLGNITYNLNDFKKILNI